MPWIYLECAKEMIDCMIIQVSAADFGKLSLKLRQPCVGCTLYLVKHRLHRPKNICFLAKLRSLSGGTRRARPAGPRLSQVACHAVQNILINFHSTCLIGFCIEVLWNAPKDQLYDILVYIVISCNIQSPILFAPIYCPTLPYPFLFDMAAALNHWIPKIDLALSSTTLYTAFITYDWTYRTNFTVHLVPRFLVIAIAIFCFSLFRLLSPPSGSDIPSIGDLKVLEVTMNAAFPSKNCLHSNLRPGQEPLVRSSLPQ